MPSPSPARCSLNRAPEVPLLPAPIRGDTVAVAGLSVRYLAEAAAQAGWRVIALDVFGDRDTRRPADAWYPIGRPGECAIDPLLLARGLADAATAGAVAWVGGGGTEAEAALLDAGAAALPRLGMDTAAVEQLRSPKLFFATLDGLGLRHPEVAWQTPARPADWLLKRAGGSGGWHIRPAGLHGPVPADGYFQRRLAGAAMSALCLADGREARLVALNRQTVRAMSASLPCVFAGVTGPVDEPALQSRVEAALQRLVPAFGLRGLLSLDFIAVDGEPWWLEVNPRPSSSMQLYADAWPGGLLRAHAEALQGRLPVTAPKRLAGWRGVETLFAPQACRIDAALVVAFAADPALHDLPAEGTHFEAGQPVCSVSASAPDAASLALSLAERVQSIHMRLLKRPAPTFAEAAVPALPCPQSEETM